MESSRRFNEPKWLFQSRKTFSTDYLLNLMIPVFVLNRLISNYQNKTNFLSLPLGVSTNFKHPVYYTSILIFYWGGRRHYSVVFI